jgi:hypothetical protein
MKWPIIKAAVEEDCSKSSGHREHGKSGGDDREGQGSCRNGNKRPAGIAAPPEKWEDFVGAVKDKGNEDDPQNATRSQAGHPVQANHGSCQHQRWEPGKLHPELREKKELKELPKLRCCNKTADQSGECVACFRQCFIGPCQLQQ